MNEKHCEYGLEVLEQANGHQRLMVTDSGAVKALEFIVMMTISRWATYSFAGCLAKDDGKTGDSISLFDGERINKIAFVGS